MRRFFMTDLGWIYVLPAWQYERTSWKTGLPWNTYGREQRRRSALSHAANVDAIRVCASRVDRIPQVLDRPHRHHAEWQRARVGVSSHQLASENALTPVRVGST